MNKIELNLKLLEKNDLSPNEFIYLYIIFNGLNVSTYHLDERFNLQKKGFLEYIKDEVLITKKTIDLFVKKSKSEQVKEDVLGEFVEKYRNLFPGGIKSGDRLVQGDLLGCLRKFRAFKRKFKYSEDQILEATKNYLNAKKKANYHMITCADYFIEKNGASMLASYCENLDKQINHGRTDQSGDI